MISTKTIPLLSILACLCFTGPAHSGLVLSKSGYTDVQAAALQEANKLVAQNELTKAREVLRNIRATRKDMLAADVLLFEMMINASRPALARQVLEQYSVETQPSFDVFYAFSKLAMSERRYFDAFMHAELALNHPMAEDWSEEYKNRMRTEAQVVLLESCEGRGAWQLCHEILSTIEPPEAGSDPRLVTFAGKTAFFLGHVEQAVRFFDMVKAEPDTAPTDLILARLFESKGDRDEANQRYRAAVRASTGEGRATIALEYAKWLLDHDRANDTIALLSRVESTEIADDIALVSATAKRAMGNLDEAIADLEKLLHKREDSFAARNQLALTLSQLGDAKSNQYGLELATTNRDAFPNIPEAWSTIGWLQLLAGDVQAARESLARAAQGGNISRDTAYFIHRLNKADGNEEAATQFLEAAKSGKGPFFFASEAE